MQEAQIPQQASLATQKLLYFEVLHFVVSGGVEFLIFPISDPMLSGPTVCHVSVINHANPIGTDMKLNPHSAATQQRLSDKQARNSTTVLLFLLRLFWILTIIKLFFTKRYMSKSIVFPLTTVCVSLPATLLYERLPPESRHINILRPQILLECTEQKGATSRQDLAGSYIC